jgi:hypothetical protein
MLGLELEAPKMSQSHQLDEKWKLMEYPPNLHALRPCLEQMKSVETLDDRIPIGKKILWLY